MEERIKEWLDGFGDLVEGRQLYNLYAPRYRPDPAIANQINAFSNSFTKKILREELIAIYAIVNKKKEVKKETSNMYHRLGDYEHLPEDLQELDKKTKMLYKKRDILRMKSRELDSGPKLHDMARTIVAMDAEIRQNWKVLDYFSQTGMYPPDWKFIKEGEAGKIEQLTFWLRALKSYPSFISRNAKNPEKAQEVAEKKQVLDDINKYLDAVE